MAVEVGRSIILPHGSTLAQGMLGTIDRFVRFSLGIAIARAFGDADRTACGHQLFYQFVASVRGQGRVAQPPEAAPHH